eukprot:8296097-Pyramimonas_sp.AAC.1
MPLPLEAGCLVRVRGDVAVPKHGWGNIDHDCLGVVKSVQNEDVLVLFDKSVRARTWHGMKSEMERVSLDTAGSSNNMHPELR